MAEIKKNQLEDRVLVLGFDSNTLESLKDEFNVKYSIGDDNGADLTWQKFNNLNLPMFSNVYDKNYLDCLLYCKKSYQKYIDIYSRRYFYLTEQISEIYNKFIIKFNFSYFIIKKYEINLIIFSNVPHEGYDFILYLIAEYFNLNKIICNQSPFANKFFIINKIENYGKFADLPIISKNTLIDYKLPSNWVHLGGNPKFYPLNYPYSIKKSFKELFSKPYRFPLVLIRLFHSNIYTRNIKRYTKSCDLNDKYLYFPLHQQPEMTTSAIGSHYADQLLAIEALSSKLPKGTYIYIKENPKQTESHRGEHFFGRLRLLSNVKLVGKNLDSRKLIQNSIGVATISGTVGWEAIFYRKPVIIFGYAWYREFMGVNNFEINHPFEKLINYPLSSDEAALKKLNEILIRAGDGVVDLDYASLVRDFDLPSNAVSVAKSIKYFYRSLYGEKCGNLAS